MAYAGERAEKASQKRNAIGNFLIYKKYEELQGHLFKRSSFKAAYSRANNGASIPDAHISAYIMTPDQKGFSFIPDDVLAKIKKAIVWQVKQKVEDKAVQPLCKKLLRDFDQACQEVREERSLYAQLSGNVRAAAKEILNGSGRSEKLEIAKAIVSPDTPAATKLALYTLNFGS
ncbi:MAG: hypothetical protein AB7S81_01070 [Bdellovibrionales bacterium]